MGARFIREAKAWLIQMSLDGSAGVVINGEHRRVPAGTSLAQLIAEVGLDPVAVATMLASEQFRPALAAARSEANRRRVRGVPVLYVNDIRHEGVPDVKELQALLRRTADR